MAMTVTCPYCSHQISGDTMDDLMKKSSEHMQAVHGHEPTKEEVEMIRSQLSASSDMRR